MRIAMLIVIYGFMSGCGGDEKKSSSPPAPVVVYLSGLWAGNVNEQLDPPPIIPSTTPITAHVLFYLDTVYLLRNDEASKGTYEVNDDNSVSIDTDVFEYAAPDTENLFYVGTDNGASLSYDALLVSSTELVASYSTSARSGLLEVIRDANQVAALSFSTLKGKWTTTDSDTFINESGSFLGFNSETSCRWEGTLKSVSNTSSLLALNITRDNCDELNGKAKGFALVDGEGTLHFIADNTLQLLWMRFDSDSSSDSDTDTDTDSETDGETEEETDGEAAQTEG